MGVTVASKQLRHVGGASGANNYTTRYEEEVWLCYSPALKPHVGRRKSFEVQHREVCKAHQIQRLSVEKLYTTYAFGKKETCHRTPQTSS